MAFLLTLLLPWWPLSPWLSPAAAWFIFFNAVVSAIAVMSTSGSGSGSGGAGATPPSPRRRLCRSGSSMVLDRLRSLFIFPVEVEQLPIDESSSAAAASHCCWPEAEAASATQVAAAATTGETAAISSTAQPSASVAVATAVVHAPPAPPTEEDEEEEEGNAEKEQEHDESAISLDEAYALAHRHRTKPLASPPSAAASATSALPTEHKKEPAKVVADWRRVPKAGEALEGKAELNARAELFIRQFREELKLERLNSVLNHTHTHALGSSPTAAL